VPYQKDMDVIIVFTDKYDDDESRYHRKDWQLAENSTLKHPKPEAEGKIKRKEVSE